jgi:hypothetical protein
MAARSTGFCQGCLASQAEVSEKGIDMSDGQLASLSDYERRVLGVVRESGPEGLSFEQIAAKTLIDPDVLMHVSIALVQAGYLRMDTKTPLTEIHLAEGTPTT